MPKNFLRFAKDYGIKGVEVNGERFKIRVHPLNGRQKERLTTAAKFILDRLDATKGLKMNRDEFLYWVKKPAFLGTTSVRFTALCSYNCEKPTIILSDRGDCSDYRIGSIYPYNYWRNMDMIAVTLLHEIAHLVDFRKVEAIDEAKHDLLCYQSLGLPVPKSHLGVKSNADSYRRWLIKIGLQNTFINRRLFLQSK